MDKHEQIDPRIKQFGEDKYRQYREWFNRRLDDAIRAAEIDRNVTDMDVSSNREFSIGFFL